QSCDHWLEVQYNLIGQSGPKECGIDIQRTFKTSGDGQPNMMMLKFDSVFAADKPARKGFNLTVETIGLGREINSRKALLCFNLDSLMSVYRRKTASSGTGPDSAQEGLYYIYMEGSSPRVKGDIARFETAYNLPEKRLIAHSAARRHLYEKITKE
ncbi:hypothetical protein FSP39_020223, partial [Pinctada imbricata]